jgi:hypothetical protein
MFRSYHTKGCRRSRSKRTGTRGTPERATRSRSSCHPERTAPRTRRTPEWATHGSRGIPERAAHSRSSCHPKRAAPRTRRTPERTTGGIPKLSRRGSIKLTRTTKRGSVATKRGGVAEGLIHLAGLWGFSSESPVSIENTGYRR